jgi:hypothetical protein
MFTLFYARHTVDGRSLPGYPGNVVSMPGAASIHPGKVLGCSCCAHGDKKNILLRCCNIGILCIPLRNNLNI